MSLKLMAHQLRGVEIAREHARFGFGHEPGLGKTCLTLAIISDAKSRGFAGKTVVVAPKSVLWAAWAKDAEHFPDLKAVVCWAASAAKRRKLIGTDGADVLIVNFESFKTHRDDLLRAGVTRFVFDEASRLKNPDSDISKASDEFCQKVQSVYLLSGTPAPNGEHEYFGLVRCIDPSVFGRNGGRFINDYFIKNMKQVGWTPIPAVRRVLTECCGFNAEFKYKKCWRFDETVRAMKVMAEHFADHANAHLHMSIGGGELNLHFRTAAVVEAAFGQPLKSHVRPASQVPAVMSYLERECRDFTNRETFFQPFEAVASLSIKEEKKSEFMEKLGRQWWTLRAVDCLKTDEIRDVMLGPSELTVYADLLTELAHTWDDGDVTQVKLERRSMKLRQVTGGTLYDAEHRARHVGDSKLNDLLELLDELGKQQLVVWCEFTSEIDKVTEGLAEAGYNIARIDGRTHADARGRLVADFQAGRLQVLVCHPAACGHGITLTAARFDYFYSLGFVPENHDQARKRIHRIGQHWPVVHYYAIARGTVDEKVLKVLKRKAAASEAIKELLAEARKLAGMEVVA
jgi:SNF2 family DNA or RNA helicase